MGRPSVQDVLDQLGGFEPSWEKRFPGRLHYEIEALLSGGIRPDPSPGVIQSGLLGFQFDWPLDATTTLRLQAIYPHEFPEMRPQVQLLSGLDPVPDHHVSPLGGNLCLLGRDTRQWRPFWTLYDLLQLQLKPTLRGGGDEDPQGEPAEYWWRDLGPPGTYCLVDSAWDLGSVEAGYLTLHYTLKPPALLPTLGQVLNVPILRAAATEVLDCEKHVIHRLTGPVPKEIADEDKKTLIAWVRLPDTFLPQSREGGWKSQMEQLLQESDWLRHNQRPAISTSRHRISLFAVAYPMEITAEEKAIGWTVFQLSNKPSASRRRGKSKPSQRKTSILPVYRAGDHDLGYRVPAVEQLHDRCVLIVGVGAVGAPLAVELARNGCHTLHLIEPDIIEPGNSVRWPLGASSWGLPKAQALKQRLETEYPATSVNAYPWQLGQCVPTADDGQGSKLDELLSAADLVIDASTSHGVVSYLAQRCRDYDRPLISLFAMPNLHGGAVVRHTPIGGCPNCLLWAWHNREIKPPPGYREDDSLRQPPGCAEPTFIGASFDLQELSLQTMRLALDTLEQGSTANSLVQTLSLVDDDGCRIPPAWCVTDLPPHPDCQCLNVHTDETAHTAAWIPSSILRACRVEANAKFPLETGGVFMGYWHSKKELIITAMIGPGPAATHECHTFEPDQAWQTERIADHYHASGRRETYLGDWHTHPGARHGILSRTDRSVLRRIIDTPEARCPSPLMAIWAGDPEVGWQQYLWLATRQRCLWLWRPVSATQLECYTAPDGECDVAIYP